MKALVSISVLICFLGAAFGERTFSQSSGGALDGIAYSRVVDSGLYSRLLDSVFEEKESKGFDVSSFVNIRFVPSFLPESQITLIRTRKKARIVYIRSDVNLYSRMNDLVNKGERLDLATLLKTVRIDSRSFDLTLEEGDKWLSEIFSAIPAATQRIDRERIAVQKTRTAEVVLDGGYYQLKAHHGMNDISLSLYDENPNGKRVTGRYDLIKILNRFRIEISNRKANPLASDGKRSEDQKCCYSGGICNTFGQDAALVSGQTFTLDRYGNRRFGVADTTKPVSFLFSWWCVLWVKIVEIWRNPH